MASRPPASVVRSVVRDLYSGRQMARVMSLTFVVFLIVPILAPSLGQLILIAAPWRYIFVVFAVFAAAVASWGFVRLPETLHPEYRLSLTAKNVKIITQNGHVTLRGPVKFDNLGNIIECAPIHRDKRRARRPDPQA